MNQVYYRGANTDVYLDLPDSTLTICHRRGSPHTGSYAVPLLEIADIQYQDRRGLRPGWARVVTATWTHPANWREDPYAWRTGPDHLTAFVMLAMTWARTQRSAIEAAAVRDHLVAETRQLRHMLNDLRGG